MSSAPMTWCSSGQSGTRSTGLGSPSNYAWYPGRGMGPAEQLPEAMIAFVARQLGVRRVDFANYAQRDQTRREHAVELQKY